MPSLYWGGCSKNGNSGGLSLAKPSKNHLTAAIKLVALLEELNEHTNHNQKGIADLLLYEEQREQIKKIMSVPPTEQN